MKKLRAPIGAVLEAVATQEPLTVRIDIAANRGTPALASMIAGILSNAGATITVGDKRVEVADMVKNLKGLHVHIDRLTWARDEEASRWRSET